MLRLAFMLFVVRPLVLLVLGLNVRRRGLLPDSGPAIVAANHNSHLDALVLMSLFPLRLIGKVHPVAAADYFLRNRWLAWFAREVVGIVPLERKAGKGEQALAPVREAIRRGDILILFPEGSRGEPERMGQLKNGIAHVLREHPEVPVTPLFLHGLGKTLPKGEVVLVPFFVDGFVGQPLRWAGSRQEFMERLGDAMRRLEGEAHADGGRDEEPAVARQRLRDR